MTNATEAADKHGVMELLNQIQSEYGLVVLVLTLIILFGCLLAWKLIWRVWNAAMKSKDEEIARVSKERDTFRAFFLDRLKSSQIVIEAVVKEPSDNGGPSKPALEQRYPGKG